MTAINRLQEVYNLKAFDFTGGKYSIHTASGSLLTAMDAFKFGRGAFVSEDMENTRQWMAESLRLLDLESSNQKEMPNRFSVLDHLAWSSYQVTLAVEDCMEREKLSDKLARTQHISGTFSESKRVLHSAGKEQCLVINI